MELISLKLSKLQDVQTWVIARSEKKSANSQKKLQAMELLVAAKKLCNIVISKGFHLNWENLQWESIFSKASSVLLFLFMLLWKPKEYIQCWVGLPPYTENLVRVIGA